MNSQSITINKYLPIAILYFFLNGFLLPLGLLYTTLLTPVFLIWLARYRIIWYVPLFFVGIAPFVLFHLMNGVDYFQYVKSLALFFTVYVFCLSFYQFLENCQTLRIVYKQLLLLNAVFVVIALIALLFPSIELIFWNDNQMSLGIANPRRLKLLTYEPSYYSLLFCPIALYYILKLARRELSKPVLYAALAILPLLLSMSFGVIIGLALTLFIIAFLHAGKLLSNGNNLIYILGGITVLFIALIILMIFFPDNVFFMRIKNTLSGGDQSFNGRTSDSFILGTEIAKVKSLIWGCGFGQVKLIGVDFFKEYYNYDRYTAADIGIPNNVGDILATLGVVGVTLKLFFEGYFFFRTRVYQNYYRLSLFIFIFIYQFTGSFIMNIAEYAIWILAFKEGLFPEFNKPTASTIKATANQQSLA